MGISSLLAGLFLFFFKLNGINWTSRAGSSYIIRCRLDDVTIANGFISTGLQVKLHKKNEIEGV